jgi:capsular polysaccharide transport system permease protein
VGKDGHAGIPGLNAIQTSLANGLRIQARVVGAVILRETRTRFGRHRLGYLWAFVESLFWVLTFAGIHYAMGHTPTGGMDIIAFLATGIITFILFRSTVTHCQASILGNRPLLFYPQVRPLDIALARSLLEAVTLSVVFVGLLSANGLVQGELHIDNVLRVLSGLLLAWLLGLGLGLCLMGVATFLPVVDQIVPILLRPMFFLSGLFFTANDLPAGLRDALLYNPMMHVIELVRDGWFREYQAHYLDISYVLVWAVALLYTGLLLERFARRRLELT